MDKKEKMTKRQIVKLVFSIIGAVCIVASAIIGIFYQSFPRPVQLLPIPFVIVGLGIFLVLKTTSKPYIQIIPPPEVDNENDNSESGDDEVCCENKTGEAQKSANDVVEKQSVENPQDDSIIQKQDNDDNVANVTVKESNKTKNSVAKKRDNTESNNKK